MDSPFSFRELDAIKQGIPRRVPSHTSFMVLIHSAISAGLKLSLMNEVT